MGNIKRRQLLSGTAAVAGLAAIGATARADVPVGQDEFDYEVTRSEAEWRAMLGEDYPILREGATEAPFSSKTWAEGRPGQYHCRGCELLQYDGRNKINLPKGWAFFMVSEPNAQMMSIDAPSPMANSPSPVQTNNTIETHCRRCGSHMGHILLVEGRVLHCINGKSLTFTETQA